MSKDLLTALEAHFGLVCFTGAGGKKTALYQLAGAHQGRVGVTSTVHIPPFPRKLDMRTVIVEEGALVSEVSEAAAGERVVAFAHPSEKHGRLAGVKPKLVAKIHGCAGFDVTFVKADGARSRWIKAPASDEPQIPEGASTVIPVVSARVMGEPLSDKIAHRVDRLSAVIGATAGAVIEPLHVARLLSDEQGALKGVGDAVVVPLINMADNEDYTALAREAAKQALALSKRFDRVVIAAMRQSHPLVEIVTP